MAEHGLLQGLKPLIISYHHPVMLPDDVRHGGQPVVIGDGKHGSEVTLFSHDSLESF